MRISGFIKLNGEEVLLISEDKKFYEITCSEATKERIRKLGQRNISIEVDGNNVVTKVTILD